jgi:hypothetical protein
VGGINPWAPNAVQATYFAQMRSPSDGLGMIYVYIDKAGLLAAWNNGTLSNNDMATIIIDTNGFGNNWDHLPSRLERLQIGALGLWEFTVP